MNVKGKIDYLWSHGMISDEAWANITKNCNLDKRGYKACVDDMPDIEQANIDSYDIYASVCREGPIEAHYPSRNVREHHWIIKELHIYYLDKYILL